MFPSCDNTTGLTATVVERSQRRQQCLEAMATCQVESRKAVDFCSRYQFGPPDRTIDWVTPIALPPTTTPVAIGAPVSAGSPVAATAPSGSNPSPASTGSPVSGSAPVSGGQAPQSSSGVSPSATGAPSSRSPVVSEASGKPVVHSSWLLSFVVAAAATAIFGVKL
jgi:hypothetical protein